jgi:hypothetical protein
VRGAKTKLQKRALLGICPCCHRHFGNVKRHMRSKHLEAVEKVIGPAASERKE